MFRTKKQQKAVCGNCPLAKTADIIGDSSTLLIVRDLLAGPKRFGDLEASLSGTSSRTLTKKLHALEESGLIHRAEFAEKPPRVEYSLTEKGRALSPVMQSMRAFGEKHL